MKILGRGGRARRAMAGVIAAGSLFAFQALAVAPSASAVGSCSVSGSTLAVNLPAAGDNAWIGADTNNQIFVSLGGALTNCGGVLTIATTTQVTVSGGVGDQYVELATYRISAVGPAAPPADSLGAAQLANDGNSARSWGSVKFTVNLGDPTTGTFVPLTGDTFSVNNNFSPTALNTTIGATGIDLTTDGTADISYSGVEQLQVLGSNDGTVFDSVSGAGDTATGSAATTKMHVNGYAGDDTITGGNGSDILRGGEGDDSVSGGLGDDSLDGDRPGAVDAGGADTVDYSGSTAGVSVSLATGIATGEGLDTLVPGASANNSFERIVGSDQNDTLTGDDQANRLSPGLGDDSVSGGAPAGVLITFVAPPCTLGTDCGTPIGAGDTVNYSNTDGPAEIDLAANTVTGVGTDTLSGIESARGSQGDDVLTDRPDASNYMRGQAGNDTFNMGGDPGGFVNVTDVLDGEAGVDAVNFSERSFALTVDLNTGSTAAGTVRYLCDGVTSTFRQVSGDGFDLEADMITDVENAWLGSGDDVFSGSDFNNKAYDFGGQNLLDGCRGIDALDYSNRDSKVTANLSGGGPTGTGDSATSFENATGSDFKDQLIGSEGANQLKGGKGDDSVSANSGPDTAIGGAGNDSIRGGSGDDNLKGKKGNDNLRGGSGDDDLIGGSGKDVCDGGSGSDFIKGCESKGSNAKPAKVQLEAKLAVRP